MKPKDNKENLSECLCPYCSVYTRCAKEKKERLFCGRGKTACAMNTNNMCICGGCLVYRKNKLSGGYFCVNELE
ncbi:MAG: DUF2769 domain-containing protein [Patescibacteria group bacterium]|nr:DUF2769 domain-containing protein [Patescibacteria group bacterium]